MTRSWSIFIPGRVPTKGSMMTYGSRRTTSACSWLDQWTGFACAEVLASNPPTWGAHQPVFVQIQIAIERPASHFLRNGLLSAEGRKYLAPTRREDGDMDKHMRAVWDMLVRAGVLADDSQVVTPGADSWKAWCSELAAEGVTITVSDCAPVISYRHWARICDDDPVPHVTIACSTHTGRHMLRLVEQIVAVNAYEVNCRECRKIMDGR